MNLYECQQKLYAALFCLHRYKNRVVSRVIDVDALQADLVVPDATSGNINRLDEFDFNTGTFTITFSEPVDVTTFNATLFRLQVCVHASRGCVLCYEYGE